MGHVQGLCHRWKVSLPPNAAIFSHPNYTNRQWSGVSSHPGWVLDRARYHVEDGRDVGTRTHAWRDQKKSELQRKERELKRAQRQQERGSLGEMEPFPFLPFQQQEHVSTVS